MPWLEKGRAKESDNLLFVHVPRCGGTSLMKAHDVPTKAAKGASCFKRLGMRIFFHRYKLLETTNFPIWTGGNALCVVVFGVAAYLRFGVATETYAKVLASLLMAFAVVLLIGLSFVFVAPTIARIAPIRRAYLILVEYVLCQFMENIEYITGTNIHGYLPHLTAHKMLNYEYVTPEEMVRCLRSVAEMDVLFFSRISVCSLVSLVHRKMSQVWPLFEIPTVALCPYTCTIDLDRVNPSKVLCIPGIAT